jgi:hypothetical protein
MALVAMMPHDSATGHVGSLAIAALLRSSLVNVFIHSLLFSADALARAPAPRKCFLPGMGFSFSSYLSLSCQRVFPGLEGFCHTFCRALESLLASRDPPGHIVANLGGLPV